MKIRINLNFFEVLTIILVVGKLSDNLGWNWAAVFSPIIAEATYNILVMGYYLIQKNKMEKYIKAKSQVKK